MFLNYMICGQSRWTYCSDDNIFAEGAEYQSMIFVHVPNDMQYKHELLHNKNKLPT